MGLRIDGILTMTSAFIFPGQGSQSLGMLSDVASRYDIVKKTFDNASDVLHYDLWFTVQHGPIEKLNQTECTQPVLLAASISLWRIWCELKKPLPTLLAGHSVGEYAALVCAESLTFQDAIALVQLRGRLMQEAVPVGQGGMAAIVGLTESQVDALCAEAAQGEVVSPANYNSPEQIVISGHLPAVNRAMALAKTQGAKLVMALPMSVPSHCVLMKEAASQLQSHLEQVTVLPPRIPVINNVDVKMETDPIKIKDALVRQLYHPVHWVRTLQIFATQGIQTIIECGPGKILTNLGKRSGFPVMSMNEAIDK